ncbi:MAG: hypothetical protein KDA57_05695 [Planctomycetales bacterium]|nr:hypothetical protein [Planctomycetales bacterium]
MIRNLVIRNLTFGCFLIASLVASATGEESQLRVGAFVVDASPPVGSPMAYGRCDSVGMPLTARGIVLVGCGEPIVLCAVDWIGISNGGYERWREAIAKGVKTSLERVSVHVLHQHDAPRCDFSADRLLAEQGLGGAMFDVAFARQTIENVAEAVQAAAASASVATHLGLGQAKVEKVASNRRILGPDGKVKVMRFTACADPAVRAEPEGTIDPYVKSISFWNEDRPIVVLTYYATHPQSYYRTGVAHADFPGIARFLRQTTLNGLTHVHFNGAGGNIGAGKYNDGSHENRQTLAVRLAEGMAKAHQATEKHSISAENVSWKTVPVVLPASPHLKEEKLLAALKDDKQDSAQRTYAAQDLVWLQRCMAGDTVDITCLTLGPARVLNMPGELAVEYQLAAQGMRPDLFVAMAAYGEYAPGYICMKEHYQQGGYEASPGASQVAPEVEGVLMSAMKELLQ